MLLVVRKRRRRGSRLRRGYGRGARILSVGIATTGVVTFAYFSVASHVLDDDDYKAVSLLWSVLFVTVSVLYRPIEQLLSRTIADRRARGHEHDHPLRTPLLIQGGFALAFAAVALALRGPLQDGLFDGSAALYWILVVAVLAYAASYFARGWLAGHQWFGLYGGLVFLEATSRLLFALAVAVGIAEGQTAVALGMAAAPFVSLVVVPLAFSRRPRGRTAPRAGRRRARHGARRALRRRGAGDHARRADAAQRRRPHHRPDRRRRGRRRLRVQRAADRPRAAAALPGRAGLAPPPPRRASRPAPGGRRPVAPCASPCWRSPASRSRCRSASSPSGPGRWTCSSTTAATYGRWGLALVALGMGFHLMAGTLNQAALARDHAGRAAAAWLLAAVGVRRRGCWRRSSTTSCCGPSWATWGPPRCSAGCSRSPIGGSGKVGRTWPTPSSTIPSTPATSSS